MKVSFRPWKLEDAHTLSSLANHKEIADNVRDIFPHPYTLDDAKEYLGFATSKQPAQDFAILVDGNIAGGIGVVMQNDVHRLSAELGYWLAPEYWNKGISTLAVTDFCEYIFNNSNIIHIFSSVFGFNTASMRVLEKCGFTKCGTLHSCVLKNGAITDLVYYEKLKQI